MQLSDGHYRAFLPHTKDPVMTGVLVTSEGSIKICHTIDPYYLGETRRRLDPWRSPEKELDFPEPEPDIPECPDCGIPTHWDPYPRAIRCGDCARDAAIVALELQLEEKWRRMGY